MKKFLIFPVAVSMFFFSFTVPARADASKVSSIKWTANTLNVGGLDPDKKSAVVGLRLSLSDSDGICSASVRISKPLKNDSHEYYALTLLQGSSEKATWGAAIDHFYSVDAGTWIVSGIYLSDCDGKVTKLQNMSKGFGGKPGLLAVTTGGLGFAKIASVKVLRYAWRVIPGEINSEDPEDDPEDEYQPIPFKFTIAVKDAKGKKLPNAYVRLTVCATLDEDDNGKADDDLDRCSFVNLGKTNAKGVLIKEIYASTIAEKGTKPIWADEGLDEYEYDSEFFLPEWDAFISVLKTKSTTYTDYSKVVTLYDSARGE